MSLDEIYYLLSSRKFVRVDWLVDNLPPSWDVEKMFGHLPMYKHNGFSRYAVGDVLPILDHKSQN